MVTDFFERQSDARKSTVWLVAMFCLAVIAIVGSIFFVAMIVVGSQMGEPILAFREDPSLLAVPAIAAVVAMMLIAGGTLFKVVALRRGGGTQVAEGLGGKRIFPDTTDPAQRRLLNVVEEMALASGTPVPPVFFMNEEEGINAFAAGYSPSDAVVGVTRGCAEKLTRDQLQGVIAHEFSHILNGDMRMSIRLIGILHGILLIGLTGQIVFRLIANTRMTRRSHRRDKDGGGGGQIMVVIFIIAIALIVLGFIGTFFGNVIKAAVSRQREYLADASAVQFTRNPSGLAGALKRIGAVAKGSQLRAPGASEASHMYFAKGVFEGFSGLWATHPPLPKRIRAIEPHWDGEFPSIDSAASQIRSELTAGFVGNEPTEELTSADVPIEVVDHAVDHVGEPTEAHRHYAANLLTEIPTVVLHAAREAYGARAIMFALLLDRQPEVRRAQLEVLTTKAQQDVVLLTQKLLPMVQQLDVRARLPLVDLTLPALRSMSASQYHTFSHCFEALVKADNQLALFEWMLSQVLMRHLRPQFEPVRSPRIHYYGLQKLVDPCSTLLSAISYAGNSDEVAQAAFRKASAQMGDVGVVMKARANSGLGDLRVALSTLAQVAAKHRGRIIDACAAAICSDQHVTWQEAELLRGISDLLDCPMPPLLVTQNSTVDV